MRTKPQGSINYGDSYLLIINKYILASIRMDLEEIGINAGNWVDSAQDKNYWRALVNAALNLRVP